MSSLSAEEQAVVGTVTEFVEREVRPVVRELEHANEYPEKLIGQMKALGIFGLAIPEPYGDAPVSTPCYAEVTAELARGWMSLAGAMGGHTVVSKLLLDFGTEEQKQRYLPRMATGEVRATMALTEPARRFGPAGHHHDRAARRRRLPDQRGQDLDHQRAPVPADRPAVQDRPGGTAPAHGHQHPPGRTRRRAGGLP